MDLSPSILYVLAALVAVVGIGFIYFIKRTSPSGRITGSTAWAGVLLSAAVVVSAVGLGVVTYLNSAGYTLRSDGPSIGRPAPDLTFQLVATGEEQRLADYRGQVVLLNLWATWCAPCLEELPDLNQFHEAFSPRGVAVLTISDEPRKVLQSFEEAYSVQTISGYLPEGATWPAPFDRVEDSVPTTFIIDQQGIIRATWPGIADYQTFVEAVSSYL